LLLLDLQSHDSHLDRLRHHASTLPEHAEIIALERRRADLEARHVAARTEVADLERQQAKADADVDLVRQRAARDQQRLDSGAVSSAKDLEALQHELVTLARRQSELEDVELEVMERLEDAQRNRDAVGGELEAVQAQIAQVSARRDEALVAIKAEADSVAAERAQVAPRIPADLVALYVKLREHNAGVGAARLHQRRCEGCSLELTASDLVRIREAEPDEVLRCEQCRRILVRTSESGL
jgi:hypothetical protein